jgi:hypothetical protein
VWALLLASSVAYFFSVNHADNDLWGHVFAGREILAHAAVPRVDTYSYTVLGRPWFNHEWLTHVVFGALYGIAGSAGLLLYKFLAALVAFGLTWQGVRRRAATSWVWGSVGLLAIAVMARGFAVRPQVFTYAGVALVLFLLDEHGRGRERRLWWLPPFFVLWANLHGGFLLGLAILGGFAGWTAVAASRRSLLPLGVFAVSLLAVMLTPYGPSLLGYLWDELSRSHPITEWQPASPWRSEHAAFFVMLGVLAATLPLARQWRDQGWRIVLALGVGLFAIRHQRHTPVFALCAAVPLAAQLELLAEPLQRRGLRLSSAAQGLIRGGLVALAVAQLLFTALRFWSDGLQITFEPNEYPVAAVQALKAGAAHGNLAVPLDWGAYVLWHLAPGIKPSIDGRFATVFPESVVDDNFSFYRGDDNWRRLIDNYPTEAVLAPSDWQLPITHEPGWQKVYEDPVATMYVRLDHLTAFQLRNVPTDAVAGTFP